MDVASALAAFEDSVFAACCAQFPRACSACRRPHPTFLSYLESTKRIGAPKLDPDDDEDDAIGLLSFANCECGSTLAIRYEDISKHAAFNAAVRRDIATTGRSDAEVLEALIEAVNARARSAQAPQAFMPSVPDQRLLDVGAAMMAILERGSVRVPPFPAVAFKVAELARSADATPEQIAKVISSDATLAAELLHLVNAPIYARGQPVTSLSMAVKRLGMKEVARLAIAAGVGGATATVGPLSPVRLHLWHRSVTTAMVSRSLGTRRGLQSDESFLAGLLHPLGSIVGTLSLEIFLSEHPTFAAQPLSFWLRVLEVFRAELGALTAKRWHLPRTLGEVISTQSGAGSSGCEAPAMIDLVLASAQIARVVSEVDEVTDATLAAVPALTADERAHLVKALPPLAEAVASLEEAPTSKAAPTRVLPAEPPATAPAPAKDVFVVNSRRREDRFKVVSFMPRALVLEGKGMLAEHVLASLEVDAQPPLPLCAVATSVGTVATGAQRLVLAPFAMSAEAARRLRELTKG
ncbi:MAG: HDOD domain-containing protein [Myxococcales bacterium]|nr:HDOD domain-containing protein [Myxococcales bacterium]